MEACTRGIWLSTTALECDEFVLLLLDTEGIGGLEEDKVDSYIMKLLVITALLSSTLVYNSNEVPQCSDLEQMSLFTHLTQCIAVRQGNTNGSTPEQLQKHFPKFVWLFRNVVNLPEDEGGNEIPLKTYLHSEVACSTQTSRLVIETLQAVFPSVEYQYLPPPSVDPADIADLDGRWNKLEDDFKEKIKEVEQYILGNVQPKCSYDCTMLVTGIDLAVLLRDHVEAINTPGCLPNLEGSWGAVLKLRFMGTFSEMVEKYTSMMEERTASSLLMEEDTPGNHSECLSLMQLHWSVFDGCYGELKTTMARSLLHHTSDDLTKYSQSLLADFASQVADFDCSEDGDLLCTGTLRGGILLRFIQQNYTLSEKMCDKLWEGLFKESGIYSRAIRALNQSKAVDLSHDMASLVEEYMEHAVGPAKLTILHHKQAATNVLDMLRNVPGPPIHVRLAGRDKDKRKIVWDPPAINPDVARKYVVQKMTKRGGWEDVATTDKLYVILEHQPRKECHYRVTSWNDSEQNKGEMEEPLVISRVESLPNTEELTYV
jgi:hypothetical protein